MPHREQTGLPDRFSAELAIGSEKIKLQVRFPSPMMKAQEILPLLQSLTNRIVETGVREARNRGKSISCKKGCSACCSQLVPVSEPEAFYLLDLFDTFDAARRSRILKRFGKIYQRLKDQKLLQKVRLASASGDRETRRQTGIDYFNLGLPCPFLEENCCSIHSQRPLSCREFLVVSAPAHCAENDPARVVVVRYPRRVSSLLYRFGDGRGDAPPKVVPLSLLFDWAERQPQDEPPEYPAVAYLESFLKRLAVS